MAVDTETAAAVGVLVAAQAQSRQDTVDATGRAVEAMIRAFAGWYDPAAITRLAKQAAATSRAGQKQTVTSTAAYWARVVSVMASRRVPPGRLADPAAARPIPLDAVYGRIADQYRYLYATRGPDTTSDVRLTAARAAWQRRADRLSGNASPNGSDVDFGDMLRRAIGSLPEVAPEPLTPQEILDRVAERGIVVTEDNLSLALRAQLTESAKRDPATITGYRRVIRPELSRGGACGLCIVASTRVYYRDDILPLHGRCKCLVVPMVGSAGGDGDVGGAINDMDLAAFYEAAGSNRASALKKTRFKVIKHSEIGSMLVPAGSLTDTVVTTGGIE